MNEFKTETDAEFAKKQIIRTVAILFAIMTLLSCLGFLIAVNTFIYFELLTVIGCVTALFLQLRKNRVYELTFTGNRFRAREKATGELFCDIEIEAKDIIVRQTAREAAPDYCSFAVLRTPYGFSGVKNYTQLKRYIDNNL